MIVEELKPKYYFNDFAYPTNEFFEGVNNVWDALNKKNEFLEMMESKILGKVDENSTIEGKVFVGEGTVVRHSVIEGPVYIGKNCRIGPNAYIRPGTVIGDNAEIIRPEIKNSIVFGGAKAHHHSYIGDSIIGKNVNLASGSCTLNLRHDKKEIDVKIDDKNFPTGLRKFGAIIGDNSKIGGNCSLNPGTLIGPDTWTSPHLCLSGFYPKKKFVKPSGEIVDFKGD
jgi:bifunctional UDP-N-acetylglucosamine pyrophosphorylase/glucosamine-1-phosphate N-acetyltransferase